MNLFLKKIRLDQISLINYVFCFFPISFVLGNLIINLNVVLFCCIGIFYLKSKIFSIKLNSVIKIIFLLFISIFIATLFSFIKSLYYTGYSPEEFSNLIKSVLFFRFFLMLLIIYFLTQINVLNFKYFFITTALLTLVISLDVIFQHFFGFNTIGLRSPDPRHSSGFFGKELIAGGIIKNFSFFLILFVLFFFKDKKILKTVLTITAISVLAVSIMVSGNRMSYLLFIFGLIFIFFIGKNFKIIIPVASVCIFILFQIIYLSSNDMHKHYKSFLGVAHNESFVDNVNDVVKKIIKSVKIKKNSTYEEELYGRVSEEKKVSTGIGRPEHNSHAGMLVTAGQTWKLNKLYGNGIKSFRRDCGKVKHPDYTLQCSNHPHNYYLEILTETGLLGIFITIILAFFFTFFIFKSLKILNGVNIENYILLASTLSLLVEIFPIRSSGSIFTTGNAAIIILLASILISLQAKLSFNKT
jgi:O-antigen ligase